MIVITTQEIIVISYYCGICILNYSNTMMLTIYVTSVGKRLARVIVVKSGVLPPLSLLSSLSLSFTNRLLRLHHL